MPDLNLVFTDLIKTRLWPEFKSLGYKKSGHNFRFYDKAGWGRIVQFQKSQFNSAEELCFTINTGLYLAEGTYSFPNDPGPKYIEPDCIVRKRLGHIKGNQQDEWYTLTPATDAPLLFAQLAEDFTNSLHPYLAGIQGREDILKLLIANAQGNTALVRIRTIYLAGLQVEAAQLLTNEFHRTKYLPDLTALKSLANEMGISQLL